MYINTCFLPYHQKCLDWFRVPSMEAHGGRGEAERGIPQPRQISLRASSRPSAFRQRVFSHWRVVTNIQFNPTNFHWILLVHIANEGPVRIQYKCLVPIYLFTEIKLLFPKQNYNVLTPSS
jgi:hypothetical protein